MKNAPNSPDSPAQPAISGARNDDSSLFSLESLRLTQATKQGKADDSGLIDLNALGVIEKGAAPYGPSPRTPLAVAPVVAPNDIFGSVGMPMLVAPSAAAVARPAPGTEAPPAKSNGMWLVVAAVAVVGLAAGAFLATRGGDAAAMAPTVTATAAPAPTAAPTPAPTAAAAPEPSVAAVTPGQRPAAPEPTVTATAAAPVAKAPGPMPGPRTQGPKAPPVARDDPPAKPVETCDLSCQMQRAVQKKK